MNKDNKKINKRDKPSPSVLGGGGASLDKLAQVGTKEGNQAPDSLQFDLDRTTKAGDKEVLGRRARSKYFSDSIKSKLCSIEKTPLLKSYKGSCSCSETIGVEGGVARSSYCKQRWCLTCCRIKMGAMINKYLPILKEKMADPYFVTLTVPNIPAAMLRTTMLEMFNTLSGIKDMIRKQHQRGKIDCTFSAVVKMESTYNAEKDTYHPHLHCVVDREDIANLLRAEWLKRYPNAKDKGQDVRKADDKSMKELLKYSVKMMSDIIDNEGNTKQAIYINALNQMFISMKGMRLFRSFGELYNVTIDETISDDEMNDLEQEEEQLSIEFQKPEPSDGCYIWIGNDWYNNETGESLCNYIPSEKDKEFEGKLILYENKTAHIDAVITEGSIDFGDSYGELWNKGLFLKNADIEPICLKIRNVYQDDI